MSIVLKVLPIIKKISIKPFAMCTALLYLLFACFYVIACPDNIRVYKGNQQNISTKSDRSVGTDHAHQFKFLSRPRLILSKKIPLSITPFIRDGFGRNSISIPAITSGAFSNSANKAQVFVASNLLLCRWQV